MHPIALEIGSFTLRWYGVMAALGFLAAVLAIGWNRRFAKLTADQGTTLVFISIVAGVIGARIFYVIQFYDQFRNNFWSIFRIDQGGLVFYGGFFLALAALFLYCLIYRLDTIRVFDVLVPSLAFGHIFGRIGCFLNGCCYGSITSSTLGVHYAATDTPVREIARRALLSGDDALLRSCRSGLTLHAVQLYEAGMNLALFLLCMYLLRHTRRGVVMSSYIFAYGLMRFTNEFFRGDHVQHVGNFTPAQFIGLFMMPAGLLLILYFATRKPRPEAENA